MQTHKGPLNDENVVERGVLLENARLFLLNLKNDGSQFKIK